VPRLLGLKAAYDFDFLKEELKDRTDCERDKRIGGLSILVGVKDLCFFKF